MLEPWDKGLLGTMLRYAYEVRGEEAYFEEVPELKLDKDLKEMAKLIIKRKSGHFDPAEFNDRYEEAVVQMVRDKQAGAKPRPAKSAPTTGNVINLMDALKRSLAAGERTPAAQEAPAPKKRASAKASQRDQPQFKLPIAGGKSKAARPRRRAPRSPRGGRRREPRRDRSRPRRVDGARGRNLLAGNDAQPKLGRGDRA